MLTLEQIHSKLSKRFEGEKISSLKHIPHPFELANIQEGSRLVYQAMKKNKQILIVGDYDADGILSTALMIFFFQGIGYTNFSYAIPNRFSEGYGISIPLLERFPSADLVITVDNGITALEAAKFCQEQGKTLIITDHHTPRDKLPEALIINPKVSGFIQEEICGCLVAWYFCAGIKSYAKLTFDLTPLLELVGIAIISDMMPLLELNRIILKKSLSLFLSPNFPFSILLLKQYKKIDEDCIGFYIAPLINASGRMAQADIALQFILSQNQEEALKNFEMLTKLNLERKNIQKKIMEKLEQNLIITPSCVLAYGEDWHEGVLGILAGKLAQLHQKSAFVLTLKNNLYQGSGRAFRQVNLIKSLQSLNCIEEFGGHKGAVGIKLRPEQIQNFTQNFQAYIDPNKEEEDSFFGTLHPSLLNHNLIALLQSYAPYGEGNPKPLFAISPMPLISQKLVGKENNHTLLAFQTPAHRHIKAMAFFCTDLEINFNSLRFYITQDSFSSSMMLLVQTQCHS